MGSFLTGQTAMKVAAAGQFAYVLDIFTGLHVIDVNNPANPVRVGGSSLHNAQGVAVVGQLAFVSGSFEDALVILNTPFGSPQQPQFLLGSRDLWMSNAVFHAQLTGPAGVNVIVDASTNLLNWRAIQTNALTSRGLELALPPALQPQHFLRVRLAP